MTSPPEARVVILIPALDESESIASVIAEIPRRLSGVARVEVIVIDDGSTDGTRAVAIAAGADHVVSHPRRLGLARTFMTGVSVALSRDATHIVQIDADGQYSGTEIPKLLEPLLRDEADLIIGSRPIRTMRHFSPVKRMFQRLGSRVVRIASGTEVPDAPSGFRAMSADAARRLHVHSSYTYTLETLIQAGQAGMRVGSVPISARETQRPSRLIASWPGYVRRAALTVIRIAVIHRPFRFFAAIAVLQLIVGCVLFVWAVARPDPLGSSRAQAFALAAAILTVGGLHTIVSAFLADAIAATRRLAQRTVELQLQAAAQLRTLTGADPRPSIADDPSRAMRSDGTVVEARGSRHPPRA